MTNTITEGLQVKGLPRSALRALAEKARRLDMTPETYVKHLVEADLAISREARTTSFAEIMGTGTPIDEEKLDLIVERAKTRNHNKTSKKKR